MKNIGIIGLGSMGMGMAQSLVRAGFNVYGYDINENSLEILKKQGAHQIGQDPTVHAHEWDALIVVLVNSEQVEQVLFKSGLYRLLKHDCLVSIHSTISAEKAKAFAQDLSTAKLHMLDAPISGGAQKAQAGKLTIMVSGNPEDLQRIQPVFDAMSEKVYCIGNEIGLGSTVKTIHQLLAGVHIAAAAESMALAAKAGIPLDIMYDVVTHAAGNSWMYENRMKKVLSGDYTPNSMVDIFVKDLGLVLDAGHSLKFPLPLSAVAHQMFLAASSEGFGRLDDAAVIKIFKGIVLPEPAVQRDALVEGTSDTASSQEMTK